MNPHPLPLERPTNGPGKPLEPGPVWEQLKTVEWVIGPRSKFYEAAHFLKLPLRPLKGGDYCVKTTATDLLLIVAYAQRREKLANNGFVTLAPKTN